MKRDFLILLVLLVGLLGSSAWGVCPQDAKDRGICDTLYVEPWEPDVADSVWAHGGPYFIRVPVYLTTDSADTEDLITAMVFPFCLTRSNPAKYCSVSAYWNSAGGSNAYSATRGIFRDLPTASNWMKGLWDIGEGFEWDNISLTVSSVPDSTHFWLSLISGGTDPYYGPGKHVLLFTMTFRIQDTMTVTIDTCFWPPSSRLGLFVYDETGEIPSPKIPRPGNGSSSFNTTFYFRPSDVKEIEGSTEIRPTEFSLSQNYPNPFNPTTNFQFTVPKSSHVKIEIFNIVGQKVAIVVDGDMKPGVYTADWNGRDENGAAVSSGIYFYRMRAEDFSDMKKMVLIK